MSRIFPVRIFPDMVLAYRLHDAISYEPVEAILRAHRADVVDILRKAESCLWNGVGPQGHTNEYICHALDDLMPDSGVGNERLRTIIKALQRVILWRLLHNAQGHAFEDVPCRLPAVPSGSDWYSVLNSCAPDFRWWRGYSGAGNLRDPGPEVQSHRRAWLHELAQEFTY